MATEATLPPIKATEPGRNGRKHTVAPVRVNSSGQVEIYLNCGAHNRCGCGGWYALEKLLEGYTEILNNTVGKEQKAA